MATNLSHPERNNGIEPYEYHTTLVDAKNNLMNIQVKSDSYFFDLDIFNDNISDVDDGNDKNIFMKDDIIANARDNGCWFLNKKKENPKEENPQKVQKSKEKRKSTRRKKVKVMKKIKKELEKDYFRILGEKKKFKFKKIFAKLRNKKYYKKYILENVEDIFTKFNLSNRKIFKKIKKNIFYPQFQRIIASKIRKYSDENCLAPITKDNNEKLFIYY